MKRISLLLALAICIKYSITAQTNVSGYIPTNTTWTLANSPYIITGNTLVSSSARLTIEPGVTVQIDTATALQIDGELVAIGTAQSRITFTAKNSSPVRGSWGRIQFSNVSKDAVFDIAGNYASGSILKYCDILYGGGLTGGGTVFCDTSAPYFSHCRISESLNHAIYFASSVGRVDSSFIKNNGGTAILYVNTTPADLIAMNDTLEDNNGGIVRAWGPGHFLTANIQHCIFTRTGDAVDVVTTENALIRFNTFDGNVNALRGDFGHFSNSSGTISDNIFIEQTRSVIGGQLGCSATTSTQLGENLVITNNYFENNKGAVIVHANGYSVNNNTFVNNQFNPEYHCGTTHRALVNLIGGKGRMMNNVFNGNSTPQGVSLIKLGGAWEVGYNIVENNSSACLHVIGAAIICSNTFQNNTGTALHASGSPTGAEIHHNRFMNNTGVGYSPASFFITGSACTISNNLINGNISTDATLLISSGVPQFQQNDIANNTAPLFIKVQGNTAPSFSQNNLISQGNSYLVENLLPFGPGANITMTDNYWGITDTAMLDSLIFDFFDDAGISVVFYQPLLTMPVVVDTSIVCVDTTCLLTVSGTTITPACHGDSSGSVSLVPANGALPYSYLWSTGVTTQNINNLPAGTYSATVTDDNFCTVAQTFTITQPAAPLEIVSGVVTDAVCNSGGAINISVIGGTNPYYYNWGDSITTEDRSGLNPGNYTVTVTDVKGCSVAQSFVIGQIGGPVISGAVTHANCNNGCDGAIDLSVTGNAPFTYNWGAGFGAGEDTSGLCAGVYNVTVADSNNCGIAATFTIASPTTVSATTTILNDVSCMGYSDGEAIVTASGGTPPYSFLWSDGQTQASATSLSAGNYGVTVSDSLGCADADSVVVSDGVVVFVGVIVGLNSAAINQNYVYSVNANFNFTYTWSVNNGIILSGQGTNGIEVVWTSAGAGIVQLIAQDLGCADTVTKSITVTDTTRNCSALFYLYPDTIPHSYFVVNTASGIAPLYYSWNWGDGSPTDTAAYPLHSYATAGFYTICLTITDSTGCTDTYCNPYFLLKGGDESSAMIQVNVVPPTFTGVRNEELEEFLVYPNPTSGSITLKASEIFGETTFALFDAMGKQLLQQSMGSAELKLGTTIDLAALDNGLYFLRVQTNKGSRYIKIVKQ